MIVSSTGDLGDIVFALCIVKQLDGGPHTLLLQSSDATKAKGDEGVKRLHDTIGPLARHQPYIKECRIIKDSDSVDWPSWQFRGQHYMRGRSLMDAHLCHLIRTKNIGREITGVSAWLEVEPSQLTEGKIVCNRTGRYRNSSFPWKKIVEHYRHRLVFVGLSHEWREFIAHFGYVSYLPTKNLLEMAQFIAGCELFIGNQSCANAIAEGLKKPLIQEVSTQFPDCIYVREWAQHVHDGECRLPDISGSGKLYLKANNAGLSNYSTAKAPPGGFQYPGVAPSMQFTAVVSMAQTLTDMEGMTRQEVSDKVLRHNIDRCPDWQKTNVNTRVLAALESLRNKATEASQASHLSNYAQQPSKQEIRDQYRKKVGVKS